MPSSRPQLFNWIVLLLLAFTWGSSFILMKRGLLAFTPPQVAAIRIFIAFLVLLPIALPNLRKAARGRWKALFLVGFLGNFVPAFLFPKAQTGLSSSLTGMLNSLTPLFTLLLGLMFFKIPVSSRQVTGVIIGLAGAAGLILANPDLDIYGSLTYSLYVIVATVMYAASVNIIKRDLHEVNSLHIAALALFFVGPAAGIYLFSTDFTERLVSVPEAGWSLAYILILGIFGTALAVIFFNVLIKRTSALFASSVTYLIPVFALLWGLADGEAVAPLQYLSILIILAGIYLVNRASRR